MRTSNILISQTNIEKNLDLTTFLCHAGYIQQEAGGVYNYLSLGLVGLEKIEEKLNKCMREGGVVKWKMSGLQSQNNWERTGRDKDYGEELMEVRLGRGKMRLSATAEEQITSIYHSYMKNRKASHWFYQISDKWRNEIRARGGLLRSKEFRMMDAYSFDDSEMNMMEKYNKGKSVLVGFLNDLGLETRVVSADCGEVGGLLSEEIQVKSSLGEDGWVEVGHCFCLGDKYSKAFNLKTCDGKWVLMTCHGLGTSRLLGVILDNMRNKDKLIGNKGFNLFDYVIVTIDTDDEMIECVDTIKNTLEKNNTNVLIEDRFKKTKNALAGSERVGAWRRIFLRKANNEMVIEETDFYTDKTNLKSVADYLK